MKALREPTAHSSPKRDGQVEHAVVDGHADPWAAAVDGEDAVGEHLAVEGHSSPSFCASSTGRWVSQEP